MPSMVRIILGIWFVAGVAYFIVSPSLDSIPVPLALLIVGPFLIGIAALIAFNLYRIAYWCAKSFSG